MPGGVPADGRMPGDTEDDSGAADTATRAVKEGDLVIVLSASGTTPYAIAVAKQARAKGAVVIAIANNPGSKLLELGDIPICLATPPEVIAGSTRLGAGSAQKAALNLMSSQMGIALGHVFRGQMVNVVADNKKLVGRATGIIAGIAGVSRDAAEAALTVARGDTKMAILVAAGASAEQANHLLSRHDGHLGPCLKSLQSNQITTV
jgi:N-acetylmuramic acid 6-phosphate etherase